MLSWSARSCLIIGCDTIDIHDSPCHGLWSVEAQAIQSPTREPTGSVDKIAGTQAVFHFKKSNQSSPTEYFNFDSLAFSDKKYCGIKFTNFLRVSKQVEK